MAFDHKRVKIIREALGYDRPEFANMLGVVPNTIRNIEEGSQTPGSDIVDAMVQNFKAKPHVFFVENITLRNDINTPGGGK